MGQCTSKHDSKKKSLKPSKPILEDRSPEDSGHHSTPDPLASSSASSCCSDLPEDWTPSKMKYPDFARKISSSKDGRLQEVVKKPGCEMFVIDFDPKKTKPKPPGLRRRPQTPYYPLKKPDQKPPVKRQPEKPSKRQSFQRRKSLRRRDSTTTNQDKGKKKYNN